MTAMTTANSTALQVPGCWIGKAKHLAREADMNSDSFHRCVVSMHVWCSTDDVSMKLVLPSKLNPAADQSAKTQLLLLAS
jgi:hypothetical protein